MPSTHASILHRIVASAALVVGGSVLGSAEAAECPCEAPVPCVDTPAVSYGVQPAPPRSTAVAQDDPWQPANRFFFGISEVLDRHLVSPLAKTYRRVVPRELRGAARNVVANLDEPVVAVNDILQGRIGDAASASGRFLANSTIGVGGIFDVAGGQGLHHHDNDFGLTLGRWGVPAGPYVYLPVAGATSLRDLAGVGVDLALDPVNAINFRGASGAFAGEIVLGGLDERARSEDEIQTLDRMAMDRYATLRSVYLQSRQSEVRDEVIELAAMPEFPDALTLDAPAVAEPKSESETTEARPPDDLGRPS